MFSQLTDNEHFVFRIASFVCEFVVPSAKHLQDVRVVESCLSNFDLGLEGFNHFLSKLVEDLNTGYLSTLCVESSVTSSVLALTHLFCDSPVCN